MVTLLALTLLIAQVDYTYQSNRAIIVPEPTYVVCSETKCPKPTKKTSPEEIKNTSPKKIKESVKPQYLDFSFAVPSPATNTVEVKVSSSDSKQSECKTEKVTVYFDLNSASLTDASKQILSSLDKTFTYTVSGYTCSLGAKKHNDMLAIKRANVVADFLKQKGITVEKIEGQGKCCYMDTQNTTAKENRRAEAIKECK